MAAFAIPFAIPIRVLGIHGSPVAWQGVDLDVTAKIFHYAAM